MPGAGADAGEIPVLPAAPAAGTAQPGDSTPSPSGNRTTPGPAVGNVGGKSLQATATMDEAGISPLVGWGLALVAVGLGAGIAVIRLRRV